MATVVRSMLLLLAICGLGFVPAATPSAAADAKAKQASMVIDANTGKVLWQFNTGSGISAAPMTYELDGKQYVAVVSGRTFSIPAFFGPIGEKMVAASAEGGTLFVFELPSK